MRRTEISRRTVLPRKTRMASRLTLWRLQPARIMRWWRLCIFSLDKLIRRELFFRSGMQIIRTGGTYQVTSCQRWMQIRIIDWTWRDWAEFLIRLNSTSRILPLAKCSLTSAIRPWSCKSSSWWSTSNYPLKRYMDSVREAESSLSAKAHGPCSLMDNRRHMMMEQVANRATEYIHSFLLRPRRAVSSSAYSSAILTLSLPLRPLTTMERQHWATWPLVANLKSTFSSRALPNKLLQVIKDSLACPRWLRCGHSDGMHHPMLTQISQWSMRPWRTT